MKKRALLSVSDKMGIVEFAKSLNELGYEIVSTGGTAALLNQSGVEITGISEITNFPECLDGRVKTLHPAVHAGILAIRGNRDHMEKLDELNITPIDLVVVNLYPFKQTISKPDVSLEEAIENIDIGGPTMVRSAAKNNKDVTVVVEPADYKAIIDEIKEKGEISPETRFKLAAKAFRHTAAYDALISRYLTGKLGEDFPETITLTYEKERDLRYGENPHQKSALYHEPIVKEGSTSKLKQLHGKELSFNNINDVDAALRLLAEFDSSEVAVIGLKHTNPCGVGIGKDLFEAWGKAYECDPVSIFGGIVATNTEIDAKTAEEMKKIFLEIIAAPSFTPEALEILKKKKNLRLMLMEDLPKSNSKNKDMKIVSGGLLVQDNDEILLSDNELNCVTSNEPSEEQLQDLTFAWKVVKHIKSNGIVVARGGKTLGIGPGQTNRIWALENALRYSNFDTEGAVMASDAFFPFSDCVELAAKAGIKAIIQPGGSIRDEESIKAAEEAGIAMVFTGIRHFKH